MIMSFQEVNFDGLVGPTHHYAGLSAGNMASTCNGGALANPREAALQGLAKMLSLSQRGLMQAVLPPPRRPHMGLLRALGFGGSDAQMLVQASVAEPMMLSAAYSASAMWAANAATISPSVDTQDGKVHLTVANLSAKIHRAQEHQATAKTLRHIFANQQHFMVHDALPHGAAFGDEGAANHTRFARAHGQPGVELFVFGRSEFDLGYQAPQRFVGRQTLEASRAVARKHGLASGRVVFLQQNPQAIDAGVFHNDVIAVGNLDVLFFHEDAFVDEAKNLERLLRVCEAAQINLQCLRVSRHDMSLDDAVASYLFNSQLLSLPDGGMLLVVPSECLENFRVSVYLKNLVTENGPIREILALDLRQSMRNGGGPACLRLRVVLSDIQCAQLKGRILLDQQLHTELVDWVKRHYRDRLSLSDLLDPQLMIEVNTALTELELVLQLPGLYDVF
jgi:succinylarginine dihydrolase